MVLPFSKSRDFRYVRVRKQTIFVASQSMEMLQSLEVSKALKNIFVLPTREQCVEERVNIRNTIIQEEIDKLQNLQLDEEQFQLQKRKWRRICFCERETEEQTERERSQKQWFLEQEKIQNEPLQITYSYWDGAGHRQTIQVRKGDKIGDFLRGEFAICKEDLIIPHQHSFYELIINKARGKSGPLFHFDVHQDVRTIADATIEKDESHPGKVVERHWYEKNKHIFPASRWERYTIHGD
ncbi:hypothetical protein M0R45_006218 [Rubus argutus]|uniref:FAM50A/XAP5 C-terminal domain-containing protein n=1 Tax=Rubus argutus TaxID=59490 RepID=A0AAW1YPZ8_RUBAR